MPPPSPCVKLVMKLLIGLLTTLGPTAEALEELMILILISFQSRDPMIACLGER